MATQAGIAYVTVQYDPTSIRRLRAQTAAHGRHITDTLGSAGRIAGKALATGIAVGTVAVGYGLTKAIESAADFQKQMNILGAVSGSTGDQLKRASDLAIQLGADVKLPATSAADAAVAMTELSKAGLSLQASMRAARGSLELATAGQIEVGDAAQITANALNQFGLAGSQATHVADLLAGAANASSGDVADFGVALSYAGTAAHAAGQSVDLTTAAIAEMANQGIIGSKAGTSLANALRALQAPTAAGAQTLKDLGIQIYNARGQMLPLDKLSDQFAKHMGNLTQQQQNAALATVFGTRSVQAARAVLLQGGSALDKYASKIGQAGNAQRLAAAQTKGFSGAIQAFQSSIETLGIEIGLVLLPYATRAIRGLTKFINVLSSNKSVQDAARASMHGLGVAIGAIAQVVVSVVHAFQRNWPQIRSTARSVVSYLQSHVLPIAEDVFNTIRVVAVNVAKAIRSNWPQIRSTARSVFNAVKPLLQAVGNVIQNVLLPAIRAIAPAIGPAMRIFLKAVQLTARAVGPEFRAIATAINLVVSALQKIEAAAQAAESALSNIHVPSIPGSGLLGAARGVLPHTGGLVTGYGLKLADGGVVAGGIPGRDSVPALLTPGEMVLNQQQQLRLLHGDLAPVQISIEISEREIRGLARVEVVRGEHRVARELAAGEKWGGR